MKIVSSENKENMFCTQIVFVLKFITTYCGLVDARISASKKDLPVPSEIKSPLTEKCCVFT